MAGAERLAPRASVIVVGGSTMDVVATPAAGHDLRRGSSVPGAVRQVPGGVGRNIAEAAARLLLLDDGSDGSPSPAVLLRRRRAVALVSVVGADAAGAALRASCAALPNLDASGVATAPAGARTPTVVAVLDPGGGELAACVADATATERHLPPEAVASEIRRRLLPLAAPAPAPASEAPVVVVVVLDGNLSPEALLAGAVAVARPEQQQQQQQAPAAATAAAAATPTPPPLAVSLFEPVSLSKAARGAAALPWLSYASPNAGELRAMAAAIPAGRELRRRALTGRPTALPPPPTAARARRRRRPEPAAPPPPDAVMQQVRRALPDAAAVLQEGLGCLILTLGELGAVLVTLLEAPSSSFPPESAAAARRRSGGGGGGDHDDDPSRAAAVLVLVRHVPAVPGVRAVSTSGAGDCLVAGFAVALSGSPGDDEEGDDDAEVGALAVAAAAAAAAVASTDNVPAEDGALDLARLAPVARDLARRVGVAVVVAAAGPVSRL